MSSESILELHKKLVYWVAETAPNDWRKVEINMEILVDGQEAANSWIIRCFVGDKLNKVEYQATGLKEAEMADLFLELSDLAAETGDRWTVCDFVVFSTGKYEVDLSYEPPPRLSGNLTAGT